MKVTSIDMAVNKATIKKLEKLVEKATKMARNYDRVSQGFFQRRFSLEYAQAGILAEMLEKKGVLGPAITPFGIREVLK